MCKEVFDVFCKMNIEDTETQFAFQCAPLISGLKISNLLILENGDIDSVKELIAGSDISFYVLSAKNRRLTVLLYNSKKLETYLRMKRVSNFMKRLGYSDLSLQSLLFKFSLEYRAYQNNMRAFPHEMGILLGYPIDDVLGFMDNAGENSIFTGYWKVYSNPETKHKLFSLFENAKENIILKLHEGTKIPEIINYYQDGIRLKGEMNYVKN